MQTVKMPGTRISRQRTYNPSRALYVMCEHHLLTLPESSMEKMGLLGVDEATLIDCTDTVFAAIST